MKNIKSEKGAITALVLVSMLFLTAFLISTYAIVSNKVKTQKEIVQETKDIYNETEDIKEIYNSYFGNSQIPIYTVEQLLKIGSNENITINETGGKIYEFSSDANYILMNSLSFDETELSNEEQTSWFDTNFYEKLNYSRNTITVNNTTENTVFVYSKNTDWILFNFRQREILGEDEIISDETLNKIVQILRTEANVDISCLTVSKFLDNEFVLYLYGPILEKTLVSGNGQESCNARLAVINSLNQNPNIQGMLRGDINEDGKIDLEDANIISLINASSYEFPKYTEEPNFAYYYYTIIGDINCDGAIDFAEVSFNNLLENGSLNLNTYLESYANKYDTEMFLEYEQELARYNI